MQNTLWDNSYKNPFLLELLNIVHDIPIHWGVGILLAIHNDDDDPYGGYVDGIFGDFCSQTPFFTKTKIHLNCLELEAKTSKFATFTHSFETNTYEDDYENYAYKSIVTKASVEVFYINPINGNVEFFATLTADFSHQLFTVTNNLGYSYEYTKNKASPVSNNSIVIYEDYLGFLCEKLTYDEDTARLKNTYLYFLPILKVPEALLPFCTTIDERFYSHKTQTEFFENHSGVHAIELYDTKVLDNSKFLVFRENSTNTPFALHVPDEFEVDYSFYANLADHSLISTNFRGRPKFLRNLHFLAIYKDYIDDEFGSVYDLYDLYIFRSTLQNDVFNFDHELERSYSS